MERASLKVAEAPLSGPFAMNEELLERLPIAVALYDADGTLLRYNRRAAALWGRWPRAGGAKERFSGAYRLLDDRGEELAHADSPMARVLRDGQPLHEVDLWIERPDGARRCLLAGIEALRSDDGAIIGLTTCFQDITDRKLTEGRLQQREGHFRDLLQALPAAVYTTDAEGYLTFFNAAAARLWGRSPRLGEDRWCGALRLVRSDGEPLPDHSWPMALALCEAHPLSAVEILVEQPDGTRIPCVAYPTPLRDAAGVLVGGVNMLVDVRDRDLAEERRLLLVKELNHRVKNTLATIQSIAMLTLRHTPSPDSFREAFEARLVALSRAHDLVTLGHWQSVALASILQQELGPYGGSGPGRVGLQGPEVRLWPRAALTLAMAFHELVANAARHGALSAPDGQVLVAWRVERSEDRPAPLLIIEWTESGGPPCKPPERRGFGMQILERSLRYDLKGAASLDFRESGLSCRIEVPLRETEV